MSHTTAPNLGMLAPRLQTHYPAQTGGFSGAGGPTTTTPNIIVLSSDFRQIDLAAAIQYLIDSGQVTIPAPPSSGT